MSWQVPTMGQSSQLRPSCVPSGKSRALMESTRGSERSCLWKRAALLCFFASLLGSWKSRPAFPPFLFFPTLDSSMFLGEKRGYSQAILWHGVVTTNHTIHRFSSNILKKLPSSSVCFSSSSSSSLSTSSSSVPVITTTTTSFLTSPRQLRSEVTGDAAVWLWARITGSTEI